MKNCGHTANICIIADYGLYYMNKTGSLSIALLNTTNYYYYYFYYYTAVSVVFFASIPWKYGYENCPRRITFALEHLGP